MTTHWTTWCLAGALAASLLWNVREMRASAETAAVCEPGACTPDGCEAALAQLDLTPEQRTALASWSAQSCRASDRLEGDASRRSDELFALLAAPDLEPARARELAAEVGALRAKSLSACVESLIVVREHLSPAQIQTLLGTCCARTPR